MYPSFSDLVNNFTGILNSFAVLLIGVSVVIFIWGVVKMITKGDSDTERQKGQQRIVWGLIGLFVMVSIWGIINLVSGAFFG